MSAYTDRTLGAATASTRTGASSRAASTVGGRAPKRKPKKKKKNSAGLRAGDPPRNATSRRISRTEAWRRR